MNLPVVSPELITAIAGTLSAAVLVVAANLLVARPGRLRRILCGVVTAGAMAGVVVGGVGLLAEMRLSGLPL